MIQHFDLRRLTSTASTRPPSRAFLTQDPLPHVMTGTVQQMLHTSTLFCPQCPFYPLPFPHFMTSLTSSLILRLACTSGPSHVKTINLFSYIFVIQYHIYVIPSIFGDYPLRYFWILSLLISFSTILLQQHSQVSATSQPSLQWKKYNLHT